MAKCDCVNCGAGLKNNCQHVFDKNVENTNEERRNLVKVHSNSGIRYEWLALSQFELGKSYTLLEKDITENEYAMFMWGLSISINSEY
jgi:hypothetical protein